MFGLENQWSADIARGVPDALYAVLFLLLQKLEHIKFHWPTTQTYIGKVFQHMCSFESLRHLKTLHLEAESEGSVRVPWQAVLAVAHLPSLEDFTLLIDMERRPYSGRKQDWYE